jgi:hypothetical protein
LKCQYSLQISDIQYTMFEYIWLYIRHSQKVKNVLIMKFNLIVGFILFSFDDQ